MRILTYTVGPLATNLFLLVDETEGEAVVVDPGLESEGILNLIEQHGWQITHILNTHAHFDHIAGNIAFQQATHAPILLHPDDLTLYQQASSHAEVFGLQCPPQPSPCDWLADGQRLRLAGQQWTVLHTPGHSPGSVCLHTEGHLLTGDLLFAGSVGRVDLPGGSWEAMAGSLQRVLTLPDSTTVYPGHGPTTTVGKERIRNPYARMALSESRR